MKRPQQHQQLMKLQLTPRTTQEQLLAKLLFPKLRQLQPLLQLTRLLLP
jgi:hypothetical protein